MNAYVPKQELALLPANRITYSEHYAAAQSKRSKSGLIARIQAWFARNSVMAELNALSDRELADIGLNRSDLGRVFEPAFASRSR